MKSNTISLSAEIAAQIGECKVGDTKTLEVTLVVTKKDNTGLEATVQEVAHYDDDAPVAPARETGGTPPAVAGLMA